jgi:hypothetical protein
MAAWDGEVMTLWHFTFNYSVLEFTIGTIGLFYLLCVCGFTGLAVKASWPDLKARFGRKRSIVIPFPGARARKRVS